MDKSIRLFVSLATLAKAAGCLPHYLFEYFIKIELVLETAQFRDFSDWQAALKKHLFRIAYPLVPHILIERPTSDVLEAAAQIIRADADSP